MGIKETYDALGGDKYAFVRFGHGQFEIIRGSSDTEHKGSKKLQELLLEILHFWEDGFIISTCIHPIEIGMNKNTFGKWKGNSIYKEYLPEWELYSSPTLIYMSLYNQDELIWYLKQLRGGTVVGGKHLKSVCKWFKADFVETPQRNAYYNLDKYYYKIKKSPVLFASGMASTVAQYRLWKETDLITLDMGSLFDAMIGLKTRGWINDNPKLIKSFRAKL